MVEFIVFAVGVCALGNIHVSRRAAGELCPPVMRTTRTRWLFIVASMVAWCGCSPVSGPETADADVLTQRDAGLDAGRDDSAMDAGSRDAGTSDAGLRDDAGTNDAGALDAGIADAGTTDAGSTDAGSPDAGSTDAGGLDAGLLDAGTADAGPDWKALVAARPYGLKVPSGYVSGTPTPLVLLLHGYGGTGQIYGPYFGMTAQADRSTFLLATPDGTVDSSGKRFWNASDACCDFANVGVDDVAYLTAILEDVSSRYTVDPHRIFVVGHSNGGFMAHRLACEVSGRIAAVVSFAGAGWKDASKCQHTGSVAVLQIHGTNDGTIAYAGGDLQGVQFPGAVETQTAWATRNGCQLTRVTGGAPLDLISTLPGAETTVERFPNCQRGAVELWTTQGGTHVPTFNTANWSAALYGFLSAHPKP